MGGDAVTAESCKKPNHVDNTKMATLRGLATTSETETSAGGPGLVVKIVTWGRGVRLNRPEALWPWKKLRPRDCHSGENHQKPAQNLELGDRHRGAMRRKNHESSGTACHIKWTIFFFYFELGSPFAV